jgi:hypothetical protein
MTSLPQQQATIWPEHQHLKKSSCGKRREIEERNKKKHQKDHFVLKVNFRPTSACEHFLLLTPSMMSLMPPPTASTLAERCHNRALDSYAGQAEMVSAFLCGFQPWPDVLRGVFALNHDHASLALHWVTS